MPLYVKISSSSIYPFFFQIQFQSFPFVTGFHLFFVFFSLSDIRSNIFFCQYWPLILGNRSVSSLPKTLDIPQYIACSSVVLLYLPDHSEYNPVKKKKKENIFHNTNTINVQLFFFLAACAHYKLYFIMLCPEIASTRLTL